MQYRLFGLLTLIALVLTACGGGESNSGDNPPPQTDGGQTVQIAGLEELEPNAYFLQVDGDIQLNVVSGDMEFVPVDNTGEIILRDVPSGYYLRMLIHGVPNDGTYTILPLDQRPTPEQPVAAGLVSLTSPLAEDMYRSGVTGTVTLTYVDGNLSASFEFTAQRDDGSGTVNVRGGFKDLPLEGF